MNGRCNGPGLVFIPLALASFIGCIAALHFREFVAALAMAACFAFFAGIVYVKGCNE